MTPDGHRAKLQLDLHGPRVVATAMLTAHALPEPSFERGNVDHVVVGPGGIFAIETKSTRGRVNIARINKRHLRQAYAEAKSVERFSGYATEPILVVLRHDLG